MDGVVDHGLDGAEARQIDDETTLRATSEKLWPGLVRILGGPLTSPAYRLAKTARSRSAL